MLRTIVFAIALLGAAQTARAQDGAGSLSIELSGLAPQGAVMVQLFNTEAGYGAGEAVAGEIVEISAATAEIAFADLVPGQYAFRLFHDVNGDGEMNTTPFGMPTEPFAFSNNARGQFGPARWEQAVFTLNAGQNVQQISLGGAQ